MKYLPWDKWYDISPGGTWQEHIVRYDFGVDYLLPKRTPLYAPYEEQICGYKEIDIPPGGLFYPGIRKIIVLFETVNGIPTGNEFEIWHIDEIIRKDEIVRGETLVAYSGDSGAAGPHAHCRIRIGGLETDPTPHIANVFNMNRQREQEYIDAVDQLKGVAQYYIGEFDRVSKSLLDASKTNDMLKATLDAIQVQIGSLQDQIALLGGEKSNLQTLLLQKEEVIKKLEQMAIDPDFRKSIFFNLYLFFKGKK